MKKIILPILTAGMAFLLTACGDTPEPVAEQKSGHVWQSQTDALQEAKTTADDLSQSLQLREDRSRPTD